MKIRFKIMMAFIIPFIIVQGGCGLFNVYKIQGTWIIEKDVNGVKTTIMAEFTGSADYGRVIVDNNTGGNYLVNFDEDLIFEIFYFEGGKDTTDRKDTFTGSFDGHDKMNGTVAEHKGNMQQTGQWKAVKQTPTL